MNMNVRRLVCLVVSMGSGNGFLDFRQRRKRRRVESSKRIDKMTETIIAPPHPTSPPTTPLAL